MTRTTAAARMDTQNQRLFPSWQQHPRRSKTVQQTSMKTPNQTAQAMVVAASPHERSEHLANGQHIITSPEGLGQNQFRLREQPTGGMP